MTLTIHITEGQIATVTLNRPEAANALNQAMALELKDFFADMSSNAKGIRVIILTGTGKNFCAGADLKERRDMSEEQWHAQHETFEAALSTLLDCPIPVIAAVSGAAFGGGLELVLAGDFIYAADTARFALPEVTLGIMPGMGGTQNLPRLIGLAHAREIILTGKAFGAAEALEWGMVNRVCPPDKLQEEALACARSIAANAPLSVKAAKAAMNSGAGLLLPEALALELSHYNRLLATHDRHEGVNAFNQKRKPIFTGS